MRVNRLHCWHRDDEGRSIQRENDGDKMIQTLSGHITTTNHSVRAILNTNLLFKLKVSLDLEFSCYGG